MAVTPTTARDRLEQLFRFAHRASRYWWLAAGLFLIGVPLLAGAVAAISTSAKPASASALTRTD